MKSSVSTADLCEVCSKLNIERLTHHLYPCRNPSPCSTPPVDGSFASFIPLGSISEIKNRRSICDICKLVAERLDKEPPDLDGECCIRECAEFCNFELPHHVVAQDSNISHFHFTEASVIFDPYKANNFGGPSLPWDIKRRDREGSHYILNFQAKAKSSRAAQPGDQTVRMEQDFLDTIGGRYVSTQANAQLIHSWIHQCESKHGKDCMPSLRLPAGRDKDPTFVIDVNDSCIVETPSQCRYIALSYVWGTASVFKHLLENTQDIRKKDSLLSLSIPATIRDAMALVHSVGECYLWVDALCIIQDDPKMQATEITRMGSIYSKALFTIIAAAGDNANSGLPGVNPDSREQIQKIQKLGSCELLTVIDVRKTRSGIEETVWVERGWTFQERVLSNRVLVFSKDQVYWRCPMATHSEERALEDVFGINQHHLSFPQQTFTDSISWEPLQPSEYRDLYEDLLSYYRQRHLTRETDLLNAFTGITEILATVQGDIFFWGLPESLFSYALTWDFTGHTVRNHVKVSVFDSGGSEKMVPFPSWSWAAWSGETPDCLPFIHSGDSSHVRPLIHFAIVNNDRLSVPVVEQAWHDNSHDRARLLWSDVQPRHAEPLVQDSVPSIGHLCFWTSSANLKAIRSQRVQGPGAVDYILFPPDDFKPEPNSTHYRTEIVYQDFIVVAASGTKFVLLVIEWEDGVAYRLGKTLVEGADWVRLQNKEWRFITLG